MKATTWLLIIAGSLNIAIAEQKPAEINTDVQFNNRIGPLEKSHTSRDSESLRFGFILPNQSSTATDLAPPAYLLSSEAEATKSSLDIPDTGNQQENNPLNWAQSDPDPGFNLPTEVDAGQISNNLFDQLHDEARWVLGEDTYSKIVWAYSDLQELDAWIYSTTSQYDFAQSPTISGLDGRLHMGVVFGSNERASLLNQHGGASAVNMNNVSTNELLASYQQMTLLSSNQDEESKVFGLIQYLTFKNLLYLLLLILSTIFLVSVFKFFVRQQ